MCETGLLLCSTITSCIHKRGNSLGYSLNLLSNQKHISISDSSHKKLKLHLKTKFHKPRYKTVSTDINMAKTPKKDIKYINLEDDSDDDSTKKGDSPLPAGTVASPLASMKNKTPANPAEYGQVWHINPPLIDLNPNGPKPLRGVIISCVGKNIDYLWHHTYVSPNSFVGPVHSLPTTEISIANSSNPHAHIF
jgi:hypothetical protein